MKLTERELQIAVLAATGLRNKAIAEQLHVGDRTIQSHLYGAFKKLGIKRRQQLPQIIRRIQQAPAHLQRARQILANYPAAFVTIQADGTLVIQTQTGRIEVSGQLEYRID